MPGWVGDLAQWLVPAVVTAAIGLIGLRLQNRSQQHTEVLARQTPAEQAGTLVEGYETLVEQLRRDFTAQIGHLSNRVASLEKERAGLITERDELRRRVSSLEQERAGLITERDELGRRVGHLEHESRGLHAEIRELRGSLRDR